MIRLILIVMVAALGPALADEVRPFYLMEHGARLVCTGGVPEGECRAFLESDQAAKTGKCRPNKMHMIICNGP